jgi:putative tryptophan/tyrosine transport system substrate-binding protein
MQRREFVICCIGTALSQAAPVAGSLAQTPGKVYRLGLLTGGGSLGSAVDELSRALASRGYRVGDRLIIESRSSEGNRGRLPGLVKELVALPVDVIVTFSYPAAVAAKEGAGDLPVVVIGSGDPVGSGLVVSLARPGGHLTGISDVAAELAPKRLEFLKSAAPTLQKVAMLWNDDDLGMTLRYQASAAAAAALGVTVQSLGVREPDDFDQAFTAMDRDPPDGILMVSDSLTFLNRKRVFEYATARRLPAIYETEPWVWAGGLMSYGPEGHELVDRAAALVDRILKGAKPANLPFEEPTRFRFIINLKTARELGLVIPEGLIARADHVIE